MLYLAIYLYLMGLLALWGILSSLVIEKHDFWTAFLLVTWPISLPMIYSWSLIEGLVDWMRS